MIAGETVSVRLRDWGAKDAFGNLAKQYLQPVQVDDVLVGRGSVRDRSDDDRPYAVVTDVSFCFPRGYDADLRGALVTCRGETFELVDAYELTEANIPPGIRWNLRGEGVRVDG